jgi:hypothetical protein
MGFRVNEDKVVWRIADGEAVLLHADTSAYYGLNQTGTLLWKELAEGRVDSDGLVDWARRHFPNAPADLPAEVKQFLGQLEAFDLLEPSPSNPSPPDPVDQPETTIQAWESPQVTPFGELAKLILSGE